MDMRGAGIKLISVILMAIESTINVCLILASLHLKHSQMHFYDRAMSLLEQIADSLCDEDDSFVTEMRSSCWRALGLLLVTFSAPVALDFARAVDWLQTFQAVYGAFFCTFIAFLHLMQITVAAAAICILCKHLNKRVRTLIIF